MFVLCSLISGNKTGTLLFDSLCNNNHGLMESETVKTGGCTATYSLPVTSVILYTRTLKKWEGISSDVSLREIA